jgi:hypothetical protein
LAVDTGRSEVELLVVSKTKEVFSAIAKIHNDISSKIESGAYLKMTEGLKTMVKSMKKIEAVFHLLS